MTTGFLTHEKYFWHNTGHGAEWLRSAGPVQPDTHVENPETKRRLQNLLEYSDLDQKLTQLKPRAATIDEVLRVHTADYLERLKAMSDGRGGSAGESCECGTGSYEIALLSAGGTMTALDSVVTGQVDNAYALTRPPGHHAEPDSGRGFCLLSNIGIAIHHARHRHGIERIAVVDWDVHHGNGTQTIFYEDPNVLALSIHQDGLYPINSGHLSERGSGAGLGATLNVPLLPGCGHGAYMAAMERVVVPALRNFKPELIIVACGFDASIFDPSARMMLTARSYRDMTRMMMELAGDLTGGKLLFNHEGGYSTGYVPFCGLATIEQLSGQDTGIGDPFGIFLNDVVGHELFPHQEIAINKAAELAAQCR